MTTSVTLVCRSVLALGGIASALDAGLHATQILVDVPTHPQPGVTTALAANFHRYGVDFLTVCVAGV